MPSLTKRILLIDDDVDILMGLQMSLEDHFDVEVACHPLHALQMLEQASFDAVVVDLMMPWMDGTKVIEQIRKRRLTTAPIILMSAYPDAQETAHLTGAADSICKPFEVEDLEEKLDRVLRAGPTPRPA